MREKEQKKERNTEECERETQKSVREKEQKEESNTEECEKVQESVRKCVRVRESV